jgi:hypothetical protein
MHIPTFLVMSLLLAAFVSFCWQYYVGDPDNRLTDRRFMLAGTSLTLAVSYVPLSLNLAAPILALTSMLFFAAALTLLCVSVRLARQVRRKSAG